MQKHIAALDPLIMAMVHGRRGNVAKAAQLFAKAITAPDAVLAIQTLEHNNQKAFKLQAAAKAEAAKKQVASKKQTAGKKVVAEEFEIEGEDPLIEDDEEIVEAADDGEDEDEVEGDDADEVEDESEDDDGDSTFEATLASFLKKGKSGK